MEYMNRPENIGAVPWKRRRGRRIVKRPGLGQGASVLSGKSAAVVLCQPFAARALTFGDLARPIY